LEDILNRGNKCVALFGLCWLSSSKQQTKHPS
jgi:hypothetical protein